MLLLTLLSLDWLVAGANILGVAFIGPAGLPAPELAHMLDSLVGVPRRIGRVWSSSVCRGTAKNAARDGNPDRSFRGHKALQPTRVTRYTIEGKQVHLTTRRQSIMALSPFLHISTSRSKDAHSQRLRLSATGSYPDKVQQRLLGHCPASGFLQALPSVFADALQKLPRCVRRYLRTLVARLSLSVAGTSQPRCCYWVTTMLLKSAY